MSDAAIRVEDLWKQYQLGHSRRSYKTLRESLVNAVASPWRQVRQLSGWAAENKFWALQDINFEVHTGQVVGIIGHNGAGKSTLLKILSQITEPTRGRISLYGRVGSLLEVGTGFHPELTGRENVFLNGAILGMSRVEVARKFDEIVEFAGVEQFLDTPVKRYSSGMVVRLAFAVAAQLEPEILVVDEVLAVGDAEFQAKCLGKMGEVAHGGRTVLFVSHNMAAVEALCSRAFLLERGRLVASGDVSEIVRRYLESGCDLSGEVDLANHSGRPGHLQPVFRHLRIMDEEGRVTPSVRIGGDIRMEFELRLEQSLAARQFRIQVIDSRGLTLFTCRKNTPSLSVGRDPVKVVCTVRNLCLVPGRYHLHLALRAGGHLADEIRSGLEIEVLPLKTEASTKVPTSRLGVIVPDEHWHIEQPVGAA